MALPSFLWVKYFKVYNSSAKKCHSGSGLVSESASVYFDIPFALIINTGYDIGLVFSKVKTDSDTDANPELVIKKMRFFSLSLFM